MVTHFEECGCGVAPGTNQKRTPEIPARPMTTRTSRETHQEAGIQEIQLLKNETAREGSMVGFSILISRSTIQQFPGLATIRTQVVRFPPSAHHQTAEPLHRRRTSYEFDPTCFFMATEHFTSPRILGNRPIPRAFLSTNSQIYTGDPR